ncbi:hypothetical protein ACT18_17675 [Mycolicibacter kumamotonensis]|uniref:Helix-turn-helix domain-containing protein n=1 Tax=Mycolicibacter kumamotonensis TaxID=354243 RepID=A0A1B8SCR1_9MYCO|nr:hypothetical protein ACT18_17675 [Mycolicibacter kumamotonensis]
MSSHSTVSDPPKTRWLSTSEAAAYLGVSVNSVRNYIAGGRLKVHRMGPKLLKFNVAELDRFVEGRCKR